MSRRNAITPRFLAEVMVVRNVCVDVMRLAADRKYAFYPEPLPGAAVTPQEFERQIADDLISMHIKKMQCIYEGQAPIVQLAEEQSPLELRGNVGGYFQTCFENDFPGEADSHIQKELRLLSHGQRPRSRGWISDYIDASERGREQAANHLRETYHEVIANRPSSQGMVDAEGLQHDAVEQICQVVRDNMAHLGIRREFHTRESLFKYCMVGVAAGYLNNAMVLARVGPEPEQGGQRRPLRLAGAILTQLGITQQLGEYVPIEAHSVKAVQMRELMHVVDSIHQSLLGHGPHPVGSVEYLLSGGLYDVTVESFKGHLPQELQPPNGALVTKRMYDRAEGKVSRFFNNLTGDASYYVREYDGYLDPLLVADQLRAIQYPAGVASSAPKNMLH